MGSRAVSFHLGVESIWTDNEKTCYPPQTAGGRGNSQERTRLKVCLKKDKVEFYWRRHTGSEDTLSILETTKTDARWL